MCDDPSWFHMTLPHLHTVRRFVVLALGVWGLAACSAFGSADAHRPSASQATAGSLSFVASVTGSRYAGVFVVAARGGSPQAVTTGNPPVSDAAWTANGSKLVFARYDEQTPTPGIRGGHVDVYVLNRGGTPHLIRRCPLTCQAQGFAWSPDGTQIAFVTDIPSRATGTAPEIAVMNATAVASMSCAAKRCAGRVSTTRSGRPTAPNCSSPTWPRSASSALALFPAVCGSHNPTAPTHTRSPNPVAGPATRHSTAVPTTPRRPGHPTETGSLQPPQLNRSCTADRPKPPSS